MLRSEKGGNALQRKIYPVLIGAISLIMIGIMGNSYYTGDRMITMYTPLVDAAMEIKLEATTAHLWFEEILSGDPHEKIETVWGHLDQADWYATAMLEGGENSEGIFIPLDDPQLQPTRCGIIALCSVFGSRCASA